MSDAPAVPVWRRALKSAVRLLGPAILIFVLWRLQDPLAIGHAILACDPWWLAGAILLNPLNIHIKVVRWQLLLRTRGIRFPTGRAWLSFLTSAYVAMLTPGRVGDVLRVQYLRHDADVPYSEGLASIVMDRLCDLYVLAGFVAFAAVRYAHAIAGQLAYLTWGCVAAVVLGPLVLFIPGIAERVLGALYKRIGRDPEGKGLGRFLEAVRANVGWPLAITVPVTAATFLVNYVQGSMIAHAMGIDLSFVDVMCLLAIASLLGLLPISVSGVGVREAFFAILFPTLGQTREVGVTFGLLVFAVIYVAITLMGFIAWQISPPPTGLVQAATGDSRLAARSGKD
jgi:uncharacterized protein (TIRG00374 family)